MKANLKEIRKRRVYSEEFKKEIVNFYESGARADLEKFFGKQIHIELYVKVNKNWRSNANMLKRFGYNQ